MPHSPLVGFDGHACRQVARNYQFVAKVPRLPRGRLNPDMRSDAAEDDGSYPTALELESRAVPKKRPRSSW